MTFVALLPLISLALVGSPTRDRSPISELPTVPKRGEEVAIMETGEGQIVLMFYPQMAPQHVANFKALAKQRFYDGTRFHRTISGFMIQGGDPNSRDLALSGRWGTGGNTDKDGREVNVRAEFNELKHERGVLSMARSSDPNSASSQFFIMHGSAPSLDGKYSAFGRVVQGLDVVDRIAGSQSGNASGMVAPDRAVVLKSVRIVTWPLDEVPKKRKLRWTVFGWVGEA